MNDQIYSDYRSNCFGNFDVAQEAVASMRDCVKRDGWISVYDFCSSYGINSDIRDQAFGWFDLSEVKIRKSSRVGYEEKFWTIIFPLPKHKNADNITGNRAAILDAIKTEIERTIHHGADREILNRILTHTIDVLDENFSLDKQNRAILAENEHLKRKIARLGVYEQIYEDNLKRDTCRMIYNG